MIYLDNNASTKLDPRVLDAMIPYFTEQYGNPSSTSHHFGLYLARVIEHSRMEILNFFNGNEHTLIFTSGATEGLNTVIKGVAEWLYPAKKHIVTSQIEHSAVYAVLEYLKRKGITVTEVNVDGAGLLDLNQLEQAISPETALVTLIAANNEIGTIQNIRAIAEICRGKQSLLHLDYSQAIGHLPLDLEAVPVDFISFCAHKIHGPIGIGAILMKKRLAKLITPLLHGAGQENGVRSGTLNTPLIVGMAKAISLLNTEYFDHLRNLWSRLYEIRNFLPEFQLNGPFESRLRSNFNFFIQGITFTRIADLLKDVSFSAGSACTTGSHEPSRTLKAIGMSLEDIHSSVRFGIGRFNAVHEIDYVVAKLKTL